MPSPNDERRRKFADSVGKRRAELGISQVELARKVGVSQSSVAEWEAGKSMPRRQTILLLSEALGYGFENVKELDPGYEIKEEWGREKSRKLLERFPDLDDVRKEGIIYEGLYKSVSVNYHRNNKAAHSYAVANRYFMGFPSKGEAAVALATKTIWEAAVKDAGGAVTLEIAVGQRLAEFRGYIEAVEALVRSGQPIELYGKYGKPSEAEALSETKSDKEYETD